MHKFISSLALVFALAITASAEVDAQVLGVVGDIQRGVDNNNQIKTLRVLGGATIGGDTTVAGALTAAGGLTVAGALTAADGFTAAGGLTASGALSAPSASFSDGISVSTNAVIGGNATVGGSVFTDFVDVPTGVTNSLYVGAITAVNVVLAGNGKETHVDGSLNVDEAATLGTELVINGNRVAITSNLVATAGAVTATMTNAPALVSAAAPKWIVVEIDGTDYVVPAFELQP